MYHIIGADQKEYGPVSADQLRQWISEGRVGAQTQARAEGGAEWKPLSMFPEFAGAWAAAAAIPPGPASPDDFLSRDYDLDVGGCISRGWELLKNNFGLLFGGAMIYMLIEVAIGGLGAIPFIGPLFSIANFVIIGPLLGGLYYVFLQAIRRQPVGVGDVFAGFRIAFLQLFLGQLVITLLAGLCMIPAVIAGLVTLLPSLMHHQQPGVAQIVIIAVVAFVCVLPMIYLQVGWLFALPLIIDKRMDFWPAMQASRKTVNKHWWQVFGLVLLVGLVNVAGMLACCVGVLVTMPLGIGAMMYGYEIIFSASAPQTR